MFSEKKSSLQSGMTLIEVLVAFSILLIALYMISMIIFSSNDAVNYAGRQLAATNLGRSQLEQIRRTPYSSLPPETIVVPRMLVSYQETSVYAIRLRNTRIVTGSLEIYDKLTNTPITEYQVDEDQGILYFKPGYEGRTLIVAYRFPIPERIEDFRVPSSPPYKVRLFDSPGQGTLRVVEGQSELSASSYTQTGRYVVFKSEYAKHFVTVSYTSDGFQSIVSGRYMNLDLSSQSPVDCGNKEITLEQRWKKDKAQKALKFTCLRTR